jgi:hypothetical protein
VGEGAAAAAPRVPPESPLLAGMELASVDIKFSFKVWCSIWYPLILYSLYLCLQAIFDSCGTWKSLAEF